MTLEHLNLAHRAKQNALVVTGSGKFQKDHCEALLEKMGTVLARN